MNSRFISLAVFLVVLVAETFSLFVLVAVIGPALTMTWMAITFFVGVGFMLQTPYRKPEEVRVEVMKGRMDVAMALRHLLLVRAGALLMLPGLLTDIAGVALRVPIVRDWVVRKMIRDGQLRVQRLEQDDVNHPPKGG